MKDDLDTLIAEALGMPGVPDDLDIVVLSEFLLQQRRPA